MPLEQTQFLHQLEWVFLDASISFIKNYLQSETIPRVIGLNLPIRGSNMVIQKI